MFKSRPHLGSASNNGQQGSPPSISYMRMDAGADGQTRLEQRELTGFLNASLGGEAAAMWMRKADGQPAEVWFTVLPVGWVGEWHESPAAQWVTALSGRWWIETADGDRIEMGPGEIHWGADQDTREGRGHRSGQSGDEPCVQLMIRYVSSGQNSADPRILA